MDTLIFPDKGTSEIIPLTVTFADRLQYGEFINGANVVVTVSSGIDPSPAALLAGTVTYTNTTVSQNITGGIAGVTYSIIFLVTATNSHNYVKTGYLSVLTPGSF